VIEIQVGRGGKLARINAIEHLKHAQQFGSVKDSRYERVELAFVAEEFGGLFEGVMVVAGLYYQHVLLKLNAVRRIVQLVGVGA